MKDKNQLLAAAEEISHYIFTEEILPKPKARGISEAKYKRDISEVEANNLFILVDYVRKHHLLLII